MSWDLRVVKCLNPPPPVAELPIDFATEPMGTFADVRALILEGFAYIQWDGPTRGFYEDECFSLEFNLGDGEPVGSIGIAYRGSSDPIGPIVALAQANSWYIIDCQTSEWIHHSTGTMSWQAFQAYRDRVNKLYEQ